MADEITRAMLATAIERLRADLLTKAGTADLPEDSPVRAAMLKTLDKLRDQFEHDPGWFDEVLRDTKTRLPPTDSQGE